MDGVTNPPVGSPRRRDSLTSLAAISENLGPDSTEGVPEGVLGAEVDVELEDSASAVSAFSELNVDETGPTPVPTPRTGTVTPRDSLPWEDFLGGGRGTSPTHGPADDFLKRLQARRKKQAPSKVVSESAVDPRPVVLHLDDDKLQTKMSANAFERDLFLRQFRLITVNNQEDAKVAVSDNRVVAIFTDVDIAKSHSGLDFVMAIRNQTADSPFLTESTVPVFTVSTRKQGDNNDVYGIKVSDHEAWTLKDKKKINVRIKPYVWLKEGVSDLKKLFPAMTSDAGSQAAAIEPSLEEAASVSGFTIA